jgi:hypothetical protein
MRGCILALLLTLCTITSSQSLAEVQTGKVLLVVENQLAVVGTGGEEVMRFDISEAAIYRNGLPATAAGLASGDWVTVTTEMQEGRKVATLVEAGGDRHPAVAAT